MIEKIMHDNILYLNEWISYNPSFKDFLSIQDHNLIYKDNDGMDSEDISEFYLPEMLYNDALRNEISTDHELSAKDFFHIVRLYCQTEEIQKKEQEESQKYPSIQNIQILKDTNDKEFIAITDEQNHRYRYDTSNPEHIINLYNDLKNSNPNITIKNLERVIENDKQK